MERADGKMCKQINEIFQRQRLAAVRIGLCQPLHHSIGELRR